MKLTYTVQNRSLTNNDSFRVVAKDTLYLTFNFVEGYGWEDLAIVANISNATKTMQIKNIKNGMTYKVPAEMVEKPGTIFISLLGTSSGKVVANTLTAAVTVEYDDLNVLNPNGFTSTSKGCGCVEKYEDYVNAVNNAANRAEAAAQSVEGLAVGWYTRAECDERFAKRTSFKAKVELPFNTKVLTAGTVPKLVISADMPQDAIGTWESPALLNCIEAVKIDVSDPLTSYSYTYSGFELRRLGNYVVDKLIVDGMGARVESNIYALRVGDVPGSWTENSQYIVSLASSPFIDTAYASEIVTSVAGIKIVPDFNTLRLQFNTIPTTKQLKDLVIWYPTVTKAVKSVSTSGIGGIPEGKGEISIIKYINTVGTPLGMVDVDAEMDVTSYLSEYTQINQDLISKAEQLQEDILEANQAVKDVKELKETVSVLEENVGTLSNDLDEVDSKLSEVDSNVTDNAKEIEDLKDKNDKLVHRVTLHSSDLELLKAGMAKLQVDYTELEQTELAHHKKFDDIEEAIDELKKKHIPDIDFSKIDEVLAKVDSLPIDDLKELPGRVDSLEGAIEELPVDDLKELPGRVNSLEATIEDLPVDDLKGLPGRVDSLEATIEDLPVDDLKELSSRVDSLEEALDDESPLLKRIAELEEQLQTANDELAKIKEEVIEPGFTVDGNALLNKDGNPITLKEVVQELVSLYPITQELNYHIENDNNIIFEDLTETESSENTETEGD